jgi:CHAD domain-containing protein
VKARAIEGLNPGGPLSPNIAQIVAVRLAELRGIADAALAADASEAQHDTRIAAKRLRYVLEIFAPCLGGEAEAARSAAKQLQSVLGDLHDCDLMLNKVERIGSVAALLRERRERHFHEFVELWQSAASKGTWAALQRGL